MRRNSFLFIVRTWTSRKDIPAKISLSRQVHENMSWYYNKSINWGDTSDFIANFEDIFVCWNKILKDTIQNNFSKSRRFSRQIFVTEFRPSWKALSLRLTVILLMILKLMILQNFTVAYSESSRTSKMTYFAKIVNGWYGIFLAESQFNLSPLHISWRTNPILI